MGLLSFVGCAVAAASLSQCSSASSASEDEGIGGVFASLEQYALASPRVANENILKHINSGDAWSAVVALGSLIGLQAHDPISLQDLGALKALLELALIQLTLSSQSRVLLASNKSIDDDRQEWHRRLADDMRGVVEALPGDRHAIAIGYIALYWLMTSNYKADADGFVRQESYSSLTQAWWLSRQAAPASTQRLCEVGFNAGHSAMAMLLSAPASAKMVSFDLLSKSYTPPCADFVSRVYPGRFSLVAGPSNETVLQYAREHFNEPRCDLVYIDGGHEASEARTDLLAMSLLSNHGRTLVIMDDIGCSPDYCVGPTVAWKEFQQAGRLRELGCEVEEDRRWCWGIYL